MTNFRKDRLVSWLESQTSATKGEISLSLISGDASFRKYYRVRIEGNDFVAVDAPPAQEDSQRFVSLAKLFRDASVTTPNVFFQDCELGFMLLEDFGDETYLRRLEILRQEGSWQEIYQLYEAAIKTLIDIQTRVNGESFAQYEGNILLKEMQLFERWFCESFLKLKLNTRTRLLIQDTFTFLAQASRTQQQVPVHRDYHSRNLMVLKPRGLNDIEKPGVIDFQDALVGPYTYDLVSLLRDAYISWDLKHVNQWLAYYFENAKRSGLLTVNSQDEFVRDFDLVGLQRQLKVMGIFARLAIRDNKAGYLADIPQVMQYFIGVGERYAELESFMDWFKDTVVGVAQTKINQGSK